MKFVQDAFKAITYQTKITVMSAQKDVYLAKIVYLVIVVKLGINLQLLDAQSFAQFHVLRVIQKDALHVLKDFMKRIQLELAGTAQMDALAALLPLLVMVASLAIFSKMVNVSLAKLAALHAHQKLTVQNAKLDTT